MKKMLSLLLAAALLCSLAAGMSTTALAVSAADFTADQAIDWVRSQKGNTGLDVDKAEGLQCVDLILAYYDFLTGGHYDQNGRLISGDARDYVSNGMCSGFQRLQGASPRKGDILIYTGGAHGHVAIYESDYSVWQMANKKATWNETRYYYSSPYIQSGYWGVIRPNFREAAAPVTPAVPAVGSGETAAPGKYTLVNAASGYTMNYACGWTGLAYKPIILSKADGSAEQTFDLQYAGGGKYALMITHADGGAVNVWRSSGAAQSGDAVTRLGYSGSDLQLFYVTPVSGGYILQSAANTAQVVAAPSTDWHAQLAMAAYAAGDQKQVWTLNPLFTAHTHVWSDAWSSDAHFHWHECTAAGCDIADNSGKDGYAAHTPGPAATATTPQVCTVCGYVLQAALGEPTPKPVVLPFNDVGSGDWFYGNVLSVYTDGLMNGTGNYTFDPYGAFTLAQAITVAARLHLLHYTGSPDIDRYDGGNWWDPYVDYANEAGIYTGTLTKDRTATRAEFAVLISRALPASSLTAVNRVDDGAIPDVPDSTGEQGQAIYALYRAGILQGVNDSRDFAPNDPVERCQIAAMTSRLAHSALRLSFTLTR